jgi:hypothetical protein
MTLLSADELRLKGLLKEALVEVLEQRREWFSLVVAEALEDLALMRAIKEGLQTETVERSTIMSLLERDA